MNRGFTFIELMIAVGLVGIFVPAIVKALSFSLMEARQGEQFSKAWALAREGEEQNMSWSSLVNGSTSDTSHLPYTRVVVVDDAYRCSGVICFSADPGATKETTAKRVTVTVTWVEAGGSQNVTLNSYVTQH